MATYSLVTPPHTGQAVTLVAPSGVSGDLAPTGPGIALLAVNGATATTVTLTALGVDGLPGAVRTVTVPASQPTIIPLPASVYGAGTAAVGYGNITTLTGGSTGVAVITLPLT